MVLEESVTLIYLVVPTNLELSGIAVDKLGSLKNILKCFIY